MQIVLPIGYHCNISFICKGLNIKKETGLFEYLECQRLEDINTIIQILINMKAQGDTNYIKLLKYSDKETDKTRINIVSNRVFTYHYKPIEYKAIFSRRVERFFYRIQNNAELIFSRINILNKTTSPNAIIKFCSLVKKINPNISITFLLIDTINNQQSFKPYSTIEVQGVKFAHKYFLYSDYDGDEYFKKNEKIWNQFNTYITELGFIKDEDIDAKQFTDKNI